MTPDVRALVVSAVITVLVSAVAWQVLEKQRERFAFQVGAWVLAGVGLLGFAFWGFALLLGNGTFPNSSEDPDWARPVMTAAIPAAGLLGGSVAVAISIRKQRTSEASEELAVVRALRERFNTCAGQLAHDSAAVRLAGVYALAALADDWHERGDRKEAQVCIDLLCAYQRTPRLEPLDEPSRWTPAQQGETEVRTTISRVIRDHLVPTQHGRSPAWQGYTFSLANAVFDGGVHLFDNVVIDEGTILDLRSARTENGGLLSFRGARFSGDGILAIESATFEGGGVTFEGAVFEDQTKVGFAFVHFGGEVTTFESVQIKSGARVAFFRSNFNHHSKYAALEPNEVNFRNVVIDGGRLQFMFTHLETAAVFDRLHMMDGELRFDARLFKPVSFTEARFDGGDVSFAHTGFLSDEAYLHFGGATCSDTVVIEGPWDGVLPFRYPRMSKSDPEAPEAGDLDS